MPDRLRQAGAEARRRLFLSVGWDRRCHSARRESLARATVAINRELLSGGVAVVTIDHEPVNSLDAGGYRALDETLRWVVHDGDARATIITGAGQRAFCAGTDLAAFETEEALEDTTAAALAFFKLLSNFPLPLIGALNGPAVGGGAMIAAQCDLLLAAPSAYISVPELTSGYIGAASHIKRLVPYHKAMRMMLLDERLTAVEALEAGVLIDLVKPEKLLSRACAVAKTVAELDPIASSAAIRILREPETRGALEGYRREVEALGRLLRRQP